MIQSIGEYISSETIETFARLCESAAVIAGAYVIIKGVHAWQRELIGRRKIEMAEELLTCFYEIRDIFSSVRMPFAMSNEGSTRTIPSDREETEEERNYKNSVYAPAERLFKHNETFAKLHSLKYRFIAFFGKDATQPFEDIRTAHSKIIVSTRMLLSTYHRRETSRSDLVDQRRRWESDIGWWLEESDDKISPLVESAVSNIEKLCRPYLEERK